MVTVYDRMPEAGGMLTYSIPAYRLPKAVVQEQVKALEGMGIRFELGANVGGDGLTLEDLRARYQSVFLATGAFGMESPLRLERGELLDSGLQFLINLQGEASVERPVGERVLVIGGAAWRWMWRSPRRDRARARCRWSAWRAWRRCPPSRRTSSRRTRRGSQSSPHGVHSASMESGTENS